MSYEGFKNYVVVPFEEPNEISPVESV
jgi:hypothetical protein